MKKSVMFSIFILGLLVFLALFASFIAPYDPQYVDVSNKLLSPSSEHLLGTDQLGRDVFSRLLYGARYSLFLAVVISILEVVTGFIVGLVAKERRKLGKAIKTLVNQRKTPSIFP